MQNLVVCGPPEYAPDLLSFTTNLNPSLQMKTGNFLRHIDAEGGTRLQLHFPPHVPVQLVPVVHQAALRPHLQLDLILIRGGKCRVIQRPIYPPKGVVSYS